MRPDLYYRVNIGGTLALVEAMRTAGVERIVFSSTCATYGEPTVTPIGEDAAQQPVNPYGRSKLMAEQILRTRPGVWPDRHLASLLQRRWRRPERRGWRGA